MFESFESGVMPELVSTEKTLKSKIYTYSLPSKKSDQEYLITFMLERMTQLPDFDKPLANVLYIEFNLGGRGGIFRLTGLGEVFYILGSVAKALETFPERYEYILINSDKSRLDVYQRGLDRLGKFKFVIRNDEENYLLYQNLNPKETFKSRLTQIFNFDDFMKK